MHSQPVVDRNADPASCQKYVEQLDIYTSRYAAQHRAELSKALHASLEGSLGQLKDFQLEVAKTRLAGDDFGKFAYEIYEQCKAGGALSEKIALTKSMQEAQSPTTKGLDAFLLEVRTNKGDCGEFPQDYCRADLILKAAEAALVKSEECDRNIKDPTCAATADDLIKRELEPLEKAQLLAMQEKYTKFMAEPEKYDYNAHSNIDRLAEQCKHGAINKGLRDAAYSSYVAATCMPNARKDFLKPTADILARISARLSS
jgi:hypothetical protein